VPGSDATRSRVNAVTFVDKGSVVSEGATVLTGLVDVAVLDDDLDFRNYIEDLLRDEGSYLIRTFAEPEELFASAETRVPDIVLLDMKMGPASGEQVIEQLLTRWPELCIIIVTGFPSLESMRATFKLRVFDYLAKPFSLSQLRQVLSNAIEAFSLGRTAQDRLRERLGHRIKLLRAERDWSLKDLAAMTKLSVSQISSIERGANLPSIESLLALCHAFGRKPSEMLSSIEF
jgi:DNA-binding NtrC family response regulator